MGVLSFFSVQWPCPYHCDTHTPVISRKNKRQQRRILIKSPYAPNTLNIGRYLRQRMLASPSQNGLTRPKLSVVHLQSYFSGAGFGLALEVGLLLSTLSNENKVIL